MYSSALGDKQKEVLLLRVKKADLRTFKKYHMY